MPHCVNAAVATVYLSCASQSFGLADCARCIERRMTNCRTYVRRSSFFPHFFSTTTTFAQTQCKCATSVSIWGKGEKKRKNKELEHYHCDIACRDSSMNRPAARWLMLLGCCCYCCLGCATNGTVYHIFFSGLNGAPPCHHHITAAC